MAQYCLQIREQSGQQVGTNNDSMSPCIPRAQSLHVCRRAAMQQLADAAMEREAYAEEVSLFSATGSGSVSDASSVRSANLHLKRP